MNRVILTAFCCVIVSLLPLRLSANPSSRSPLQPLAVHGTVPEAQAMAAAGVELVNAAEKFLEQLESPDASPKLTMAVANNLYRFRGELSRTGMHGERLTLMGEPIGGELSWRASNYGGRIHTFVLRVAGAPEAAKFRQKLLQDLDRSMAKREERLAQIRQWIEAGDIEQAGQAYEEVVVFINSTIYFLSPTDVAPRLGTFLATGSQLAAAATTPRAIAARQKFEEAVAKQRPDAAALNQWAATVAAAIRSSGEATLADGSMGPGPACLAELLDRWASAHAAWQRIAGLSWASRWHTSSPQNAIEMTDMATWNLAVSNAATQIIEADAQWIQPERVPQQHQAYLQTIARDSFKLGNTGFVQQAKSALDKLVSRSPTYAQNAANYEAATRDMLAFRSRAAQQAAQSIRAGYPNWNYVVATQARADGLKPGVFPERAELAYPSLSGSATATVNAISPKLIDQRVSVDRIIDLGPQSRTAAASLQQGCYATVMQIRLPESELSKIEGALMISSDHPPLSLAASETILSAKTGNYVAGGGKVAAVHLEPTLSRFITIIDAASVIVPRGEIPPTNEQTMMNQLLVRADIMTDWVQHPLGIYKPQ